MDLNFEVRKQIISRTDKEKVVNLSENYLRLCFDFKTDDWEDCTKFALFKHDDSTTRIGLIEDMVVVPSSLLTGDRLVFSIYGLDTPNDEVYRITTNLVRLYLLNSGYTSEVDDPIPPEPVDIVEEIYIAINNTETVCKEYTDTGLSGKSDVGHTHVKSDITDFAHNHDDRYYTESETDTLLNSKSDIGHTHTKSDITDFSHNHDERYYTETETDTLLNSKSDIGHNHDDRYYTESEVDALITEAIHDLDNRIAITSNPSIIQSGEVADISVQLIQDGVPLSNKDIYFYEILEPSLTLTADKSIIQTDEVADISAKLKDIDGSLVQDTDVYFFIEEEENVVEQDNNESLENEINDINEEMEDVNNDSEL